MLETIQSAAISADPVCWLAVFVVILDHGEGETVRHPVLSRVSREVPVFETGEAGVAADPELAGAIEIDHPRRRGRESAAGLVDEFAVFKAVQSAAGTDP